MTRAGALPGRKPGNARLARVVARVPIDFGVDHFAGDFDAHVLARLVHIDEFGFHRQLSTLEVLVGFDGAVRPMHCELQPWCERGELNPQSLSATGS